jgi:hypothetical protein
MGSNAIVDGNQGGGSKKAGFPYQIGRSYQSSIVFGTTDPVSGRCCKLKNFQMNLFPNARPSRPIGSTGHFVNYWHIPGTGNP